MLLTRLKSYLVVVPATGLVAGLLARWLGQPEWADPVWTAATVVVILALAAEIVTSRQFLNHRGRESAPNLAANTTQRQGSK
ncbi:MAG: hypothetical protein Q8S29_00135 [Phreatobacter sp.]|nr:hypothetical protein [Phreatobacter sp.]